MTESRYVVGMTVNTKRILPLDVAKQIYIAFGEQTDCMGWDEMFANINVEDASEAASPLSVLSLSAKSNGASENTCAYDRPKTDSENQ